MMPTYLITGANRGIGLELVRQIVSTDTSARIIATVRSLSKTDLTDLQSIQSKSQEEDKIQILECDTSCVDSINALGSTIASLIRERKIAPITHLINNAGTGGPIGPSSIEFTKEDLSKYIEINTLGPALVTSALLPSLVPPSEGSLPKIINISSGTASMAWLHIPPVRNVCYSISKV